MPVEEGYDSDASSTKSESDNEYDASESKEIESPIPAMKKGRRQTVMAAAVVVDEDWEAPYYEKTEEENTKLKAAIESNILFAELEDKVSWRKNKGADD